MLLLEGYISNFTCARDYFFYIELVIFMSTNLSLDKLIQRFTVYLDVNLL
jgi:hypothetical protein